MKRLLSLLVMLLCVISSNAVLKEKDLPQTLGVLKAELKSDYEKQLIFKQRYEQMSNDQHLKLINYMKRCEQIGLILYSQKIEFTFDMAYACQEATVLFRQLNLNTLPYDRIRTRLEQEIERYTNMVNLLKTMPPAIGEAKDSIMSVDSLLMDIVAETEDSLLQENVANATVQNTLIPIAEEVVKGPFELSGEELTNRDECLKYAEEILASYQYLLEEISKEQNYYDEVATKANKLHEFAQSRYLILQQSIFQDGGSNYFALLFKLPWQIMQVKRDFVTKYEPLDMEGKGASEWRGLYVAFISIFMVIYITIAILISNIILRFLMPKRFRTEKFKQRRYLITYVLGVALFAIFVAIARAYTERNIVLMGTSLMITFAWLMEVIFLSLLFRLSPKQMKSGTRIYMPFILMALVVIVCRIILIPNSIINLFFPPIILLFTWWQGRNLRKLKHDVPHSDMFYSYVSFTTMIIATIAAWVGYTLMAVEIMMWWMFQLTFIQTITCFYDLLRLYEEKKLIYKLDPKLKELEEQGADTTEEREYLINRIKKGKYINQTWLHDFFHMAGIPVFAVLSALISIFMAAQIFEMTSLCIKVFMTNFIDKPEYIQLSLFKICMVAGLWFVFKYINYAVRSTYHHIRRRTLGDTAEDYNTTLSNNIISMLIWGTYTITTLILLRVPSTGISVVTAGLATGMGFAMKDLLENFFYGISLMSGRVRVGDYIECDGIRGKVESITYQSTMILTMDGCVIAILNSSLFSKNFKNLTRNHQYELVKIPIGVAYGSNVEQVRSMLIQALTPVCSRVNNAGKSITDVDVPIKVAFSGFGDNSVDLVVCIWMLVEESRALSSEVREVIYNTLNENNINIPFPQRDIYIHEMPTLNQ